jgi:VWFA-related protein
VGFVAALLCSQAVGQATQAGAGDAPLGGDPQKQLADAANQPATGTFDASVGILRLDVAVTDQSGKPVTGLESKDFTLLDNKEPQKIVTFKAFDRITLKPEPPVELVLVIDEINLWYQHPTGTNPSEDPLLHVERELERFLRQNGGRLSQPVTIYRVTTEGVFVTQQPSTDGNALAVEMKHKKSLRTLVPVENNPSPSPTWYFHNGRRVSRNQLSLSALGAIILEERQRPGRKLMVWLGGGWPVTEWGNISSFDWVTEFSTRLREARVAMFMATSWPYPVRQIPYQNFLQGIKSARRVSDDYLIQSMALEVLATESGGRVLEPEYDLAGEIQHLVDDASTFYTISFDPPRTDQVDEYHDLKVQVSKPGLEAWTNRGYYDQPSFYDQPPHSVERVTVEKFEQILGAAQGSSDSEMAAKLSGLELAERMSSTKLTEWKARMPGTKARTALVAVADASAFLNPPVAEVPDTAAPDMATQRLMISKTVDYLVKTLPRLPNFFATRSTLRFRETGQKDNPIWKTVSGDESLHSEGVVNATVNYRNGSDLVDAPGKGNKPKKDERTMDTRGTFGPVLSTVIVDAAHGHMRWSRWEQGKDGVRAVFRYTVPKAESHYELSYCCLTDGDGTRELRLLPGYHGEVTIDPDSGAILRLTVAADLGSRMPLERSDIMVEYGPETIGGNTHICPVRSVSVWRGRRKTQVNQWGKNFKLYGPFETMIDDVSFEDYHMFRGEAHILTGYVPVTDEKQGDSGSGGSPGAAPKK